MKRIIFKNKIVYVCKVNNQNILIRSLVTYLLKC